jgi:hypothetical protein
MALLLTAGAVAAGLAGCEYADDVGPSPAAAGPSARSSPASAPLPTRDPEVVAAETGNLLMLEAILDGSQDGPFFGGSGGIGDTSSGGFSVSSKVVRAGRYKVAAACVGAPDAHLSVIQGAREGGTLLGRDFDCGSVTGALLDLEPGDVLAHVVRYGGGVPGPATGAVAGIRISFYGPGR